MVTGLFIGRFQPFHLGHLSAIKQALKQVDWLIIGVGSSQESRTKENPFTIEERINMIENTLADEGIKNCSIYPIPDINEDIKWVEHVQTLVPKFETVFTGNPLTEKLFKEKGYKVKRIKILSGINGTTIRDKMVNNEEWEMLVPLGTVKEIMRIKGVKKVKEIMKKSD